MTPVYPTFRKVVPARVSLGWSNHRIALACVALLLLSFNLFFLVPSAIESYNGKLEAAPAVFCHEASTEPDTPPPPPPPPPPPIPTPIPDTERIPNIVHYVYVLSDPDGDFGFQFKHFLSIYSAWYYWKPDAIYLHTNAAEDGPAMKRAREGKAGIWNKRVFTTFDNLRINTVPAPTHTKTGIELQGIEHRSDFVRVKAVHGIGGAYIDFDVHALRDIRILRESGFKSIAGRQLGGQINSGIFLSVRNGRLLKLWMDNMDGAYTGGWTTHSNEVITKFGERLVREPGEMLIMERDALAPGSWNDEDTDALFGPHDDVPSNLPVTNGTTMTVDPASLPEYDEGFDQRWDAPHEFPSWAKDWSSSYMLHAFTADRWGHEIAGFTHISPRYVLERRSNFARAVYPIARRMLQEGIIDVNDSHDGL